MDHYVSHEMVLGRLREKVEARETELWELMAWKEVQVNKFDLTNKLLEESEAQVQALKEVLKDKESEISEAKSQLRQAKKDAVWEYHNSDTLLKELGVFFSDNFDDCFCQVKVSFLDLDLSHVSINA